MLDDKAPKVPIDALTLRDALDLATLVEEEAKDRYLELAEQMELHHNPEAARFFRFMLKVEGIHEDKLASRRRELFGDAPRAVRREMIFDVEAPEYHEVDAEMSVREALLVSLRAERKAHEFFAAALGRVVDGEARALFAELRDEELEHQALIEKELAKLPPEPAVDGRAFADDPVPQ